MTVEIHRTVGPRARRRAHDRASRACRSSGIALACEAAELAEPGAAALAARNVTAAHGTRRHAQRRAKDWGRHRRQFP
ncbi:hypothetical protein WI98_02035 [Burkholderia vietnamiensis]|nr:hypothetical protein WI98_02035 [Burkholderia vietnamiensis]TPQ43554.1 hypothetical protein C2U71_18560 [Burkholderia ubonensis]